MTTEAPSETASGGVDTARYSLLVGLGILFSKLSGLIRERALAHYLGNGDAADVFRAGLRIPNFLQNLFGEGVLSASFIPVYSQLLARGDRELARSVASTVFLLLMAVTAVFVALGVSFAPLLTDVIAPGFEGEKRAALIEIVRILFPGIGLLVLSAWCLGVLNSHRAFFLPYAAPVIWNGAVVGALLLSVGNTSRYELAEVGAWGVVVGSISQLCVQIPKTLGLLGGVSPGIRLTLEPVQRVLRNFIPVLFGRGVIQVSAYIDSILASFLTAGAVAALGYAQTITLVPISLFGIAVSAAELPVMSGEGVQARGGSESLRDRIRNGLQRVEFFVVPSSIAFVVLGDLITALLFETGRFGREDTVYVWGILIAGAIGLLPTTQARLYASAFYARNDPATPFRAAVVRVTVAALLGYGLALYGPGVLRIDSKWGAAGIAFSGGVGAWVEYLLLRAQTVRELGVVGTQRGNLMKLLGAVGVAALSGIFVRTGLAELPTQAVALVSITVFGLVYVGMGFLLQVPEARGLVEWGLRRMKKSSSCP